MTMIEYTLTDFHAPDSKCRGTLADLILDADIIPPCALIPPFPVVATVLRTGGGSGGMSPGCCWEPFDLLEEDYWQAVEKLESLTPSDLASRSPVRQFSDELRPDYAAQDTDDYGL